MRKNSYKKKALKSFKWTFLTEIILRLTGPIVTLILVRILSPHDFGLFASANLILMFALNLQDFGLNKTIIRLQKKELTRDFDSIFLFVSFSSLLLYVVSFFTAPYIARFYNAPNLTLILRILMLAILFPNNLLVSIEQKKFSFKKVFVVQVISTLSLSTLSLILAIFGLRSMSLAIGSLFSTFSVFIFLFTNRKMQIKWRFKLSKISNLLKQSFWIFLENILVWFYPFGEFLLIGKILGLETLGIYQLGYNFVALIFALTINHFLPISYSLFSKIRASSKIAKYLKEITKIFSIVSFITSIGLIILAEPISKIFFNKSWHGIAIIIAASSFRFIFSQIINAVPEALRAAGRADLIAKIYLATILYSIPIYILALNHSLNLFLIVSILLTFVDNFIFFNLASKKVFKIPMGFYFKNISFKNFFEVFKILKKEGKLFSTQNIGPK